MKFGSLVFGLIVFNIESSFNLAKRAQTILQEFNSQRLKSSYGKDLFNEIQKKTNNFTKNLAFEELEKYVDSDYLDYLTFKEAEKNTNSFVAVVWPVVVGHEKLIKSIFEKYCNIISYKRILLDKRGARNFLSQIPTKALHPTGVDLWFKAPCLNYNPLRVYLLECKENPTNYNEMKRYLTKIFSNNHAYIDRLEEKFGRRAIQNLFVTTKCKNEVRAAVKIPYAMHINDLHGETVEMAKMVFNKNSIDCLKHASSFNCKRFNMLEKLLRSFLFKNESYLSKVIIYNSAVLSVFGLRDCGDIDFLHDHRIKLFFSQMPHKDLSIQNQFFKRHYVILEDLQGKTYILEDCPKAFFEINLDATTKFKKKISIDELLYNPGYHFYFYGIKYATLDFMHYFKKSRGRPKDVADVKLIEGHFLSRN